MKNFRFPYLLLIASVVLALPPAVFPLEGSRTQTAPAYPDPGAHERAHGMETEPAASLQPGHSLPALDIRSGGEIFVSDGEIVSKPWSSKNFDNKGKIQIVQYVAASRSAARQNKSFNDLLKKKQFSSEELDTTVIVHMADTMPFFKSFVVNRMAKNKARYETINFVVDDEGVGLQRWGMKNKSYAIIVLDAEGKILFAKDGPLSEIEVKSAIELIENQIS
jgi:YtfJ family uncharacterized protein